DAAVLAVVPTLPMAGLAMPSVTRAATAVAANSRRCSRGLFRGMCMEGPSHRALSGDSPSPRVIRLDALWVHSRLRIMHLNGSILAGTPLCVFPPPSLAPRLVSYLFDNACHPMTGSAHCLRV